MFDRKESSEGCYYPTFLCMDLDTNDNLQYLLHYPQNPCTEALFLHEYIHYLQDLTTVSGYAQICVVVDNMKWASRCIKKKRIHVPLDPFSVTDYYLDINAQHLKTSIGNGRIKNDPPIHHITDFDTYEKSMRIPNGMGIDAKIDAVLTFTDCYGQEYKYHVGEYAISECQAYMVEQHIYPNTIKPNEPAPDCPYRVVQKIFERFCPKYDDTMSMIAACEACLMHGMPGLALKNLIDELNATTKKITAEEVFFLGVSGRMLNKSGQKISYFDRLKEYNGHAMTQLRSYFKASYFEPCKKFVEGVFAEAYQYRINNPCAILKIAQGGWIFANAHLKTAVSLLGCSSILNKANDMFQFSPRCYPQECEPGAFAAFRFLHELLFTEKLPNNHMVAACPMKVWCQKSFKKNNLVDITARADVDCDHYPWHNVDILPILKQCIFGRVAATYGMQGKKLR